MTELAKGLPEINGHAASPETAEALNSAENKIRMDVDTYLKAWSAVNAQVSPD